MTPHEAAVYVLCGRPPPALTNSDRTMVALQDYLNYAGVKFFTAKEMVTPHNMQVAESLGFVMLIPKPEDYHKGVALALLADRLREVVKGPIKMRNWYRPSTPPYNAMVGGASESDHVTACAVDLDFQGRFARSKAESYLLSLYDKKLFDLSLGLGARSIHVGMYSPKGQRKWTYGSYDNA